MVVSDMSGSVLKKHQQYIPSPSNSLDPASNGSKKRGCRSCWDSSSGTAARCEKSAPTGFDFHFPGLMVDFPGPL